MHRKKNMVCTRSVDFQLDTAACEASDGRTLDGYAAVFNQSTRINSWEGIFDETIAPGAFKKTLSERKPIMQYNHGRDARVGSAPIGTFDTISEDGHGLHTVGRLFDHPDVERIRQGIESGDIRGMSFTFRVVRDEWSDKDGRSITDKRELQRLLYEPGQRGPLKRTVRELSLSEAGPVLNPAYEGTSVGVRNADDVEELEREEILETYCRTAGLDQSLELIPDDVERWLDAEQTYFRAVERAEAEVREWLEAENTYRWLTAEAEFKTSESDAANRTSDTDTQGDAAKRTSPDPTPTKTPARKRMSTINEMQERIAAIEVRMEELGNEYRDASMPEAQDREFTEISAEREALKSTIEKVQARLEVLKGFAKTSGNTEGAKKETPAFHNKSVVRDLEEIRNDVSSRDEYAHEVRENVMRMVDSKEEFKPAGRLNREDVQERIEGLLDIGGRDEQGYTIGERLLVTSSDVYERAFFKAAASRGFMNLTNEERDALQLGSDANGGYAIPVQLDPTVIWTNAGVINPLRQLAEQIQIVGKEWQGVTSAGTSVTRHAEGSETDNADWTLDDITVRTQRVDGFTTFTFEADLGWAALRNNAFKALRDAKEKEEATAFLTHNGTGLQANGLLGTLVGNTVTTAGAGALDQDDLYAMEDALDSRYQLNASWLGHKSIFNLARQWDTAGGAQLWARIGEGQPNTLLDYPVYRSSEMAKTITAAAKVLVLGDFSNFLIVDRIGMNADIIPHVMGANNRPTGKRGIFAWWMNNSKILVPEAFKVLVGHA